ncbi:MAG: efflux transporter outer membrane subunit [Caulobacteraceae bacterium]|nr:efflux transporter outer membrane subunit [Caulobacter sp.]
MTRRLHPALGALAAAALCACTLEPRLPHAAPDVTPAAFPSGGMGYMPGYGDGFATAATPWERFFVDPKLRKVIALALRENRDLRVAALDIVEARAQYRVQRADLLPTVDASAGFTTGRESSYGVSGTPTGTGTTGTGTGATGTGTAGTGTGTTGTGTTGVGTTGFSSGLSGAYRIYDAQLGFSDYELDVFGRVRSLTKEAFEQYLATTEGRRSTQISIVAEVATDWLTYAADLQRLQTERATLKAEQASLDITQNRFKYGIASLLDVQQAQTAVETAQSNIQTYLTQAAQDQNALNLVVGQAVPVELLPGPLGGALVTQPEAPAGLDSRVLLARPDVRQAEHQLRAYNADIGAARAAFFPTIALTGSGGSTSLYLNKLFTAGTGTYSFGPSVSLPIFDFGRNRANLAYSKAQRDAALATYEKSIQSAFTDVANALAQRANVDELIASQERLVQATSGSLQLSTARYERGVDTYLNVLTAQLNLASAQQTLISARLTRASNLVSLYRALGGGLGEEEVGRPAARDPIAPSADTSPRARKRG